jgi:hypothetical protein
MLLPAHMLRLLESKTVYSATVSREHQACQLYSVASFSPFPLSRVCNTQTPDTLVDYPVFGAFMGDFQQHRPRLGVGPRLPSRYGNLGRFHGF